MAIPKKEQFAQNIVLSVSNILARNLSFDEALTNALQMMCERLGWLTASYWELDEEDGLLRCQKFFSSKPCPNFEAVTKKLQLRRGEGLPGHVWRERVPVWILDVVEASNFPRHSYAQKDGLHAAFAFPVTIRGKFLGVFEFFNNRLAKPDQDLLDAFAVVGTELGQFFERQRFECELERQAKVNEFAADIGIAVNQVGSLASILQDCARLTNKHFGASLTDIWIQNENENGLTLAAHEVTVSRKKKSGDPVKHLDIDKIIAEGKPRSSNDAENDPYMTDKEWARREGITAFAALPLMMDSKKLGAIAVFSKERLAISTRDALCRVTSILVLCIARKFSEEKLLASEGRFRIFANNVDECLFVSAPLLTEHYYVSPAFEKIWGLPVSAVYENPDIWADYIVPEHKERVLEYASRLVGYEMPEPEIEYQIKRPDGKVIWLRCKIFAVIDQKDGSCHVCGQVSDITERKAAEQRVSEFYSMVSHELRTPLTSIKGAVLLLERGKAGELSERARQLLQLGREECDRLIRLINDMLDIKTIEAGKLTLYRQNLDAADVLVHTVENLTGFASERKVLLKARIETAARCVISADKDRIVQVLTNLISNAVRFSPTGSQVTVALSTAGDYARFSVKDTGPGISKRDQDKLFKVFQQIVHSETIAKDGTGLGLAICKGIVDEHGGHISVQSDEGSGATFWFDIPMGESEEAD